MRLGIEQIPSPELPITPDLITPDQVEFAAVHDQLKRPGRIELPQTRLINTLAILCNSLCYIAENDDVIVATASAHATRRKGLFIERLVVDSDVRGAGIGSSLLEHIEEDARNRELTHTEVHLYDASDAPQPKAKENRERLFGYFDERGYSKNNDGTSLIKPL